MAKLTSHVLDIASGKPAAGMRIELRTGDATRLVEAITNDDGRTSAPLLQGEALRVGRYVLVFHVAEYFRRQAVPQSDPPFLDEVSVNFNVADAAQNYHVPLLVSPWSYSTYRGS